MLELLGDFLFFSDQDVELVFLVLEFFQNLFNNRIVYVFVDVMDDQLKFMWFILFQVEEIDIDLDLVKVDLIEFFEKCCSDFDLYLELECLFLLELLFLGRIKIIKGFKFGKYKYEIFIILSGKFEYIEFVK